MKYFRITCILPHLLLGVKLTANFNPVEQQFVTNKKRKMKDFIIDKRKLEQGNFGEVKVFTKKRGGAKFVMKSANQVENKAESEKQFINEIKVVADINGRGGNHFATVEGFIVSNDEQQVTHIIYEYGGIQLYKHVNKQILPNKSYGKIMKGMAEAVLTLHSLGWIHNDIKPENFLINDASEIRIVDFGSVTRKNICYFGGTGEYIAPERVEAVVKEASTSTSIVNYDYGEASDVFALGVSFYAILIKETPFLYCMTV